MCTACLGARRIFHRHVARQRQLQVITACTVLVDNSATMAGFRQEIMSSKAFTATAHTS